MRTPETAHYEGREQAQAKHDLLARYLQQMAYKVLQFSGELTYIDAFAGPWGAQDEAMLDTSFGLAISILDAVRADLASRGKAVTVRCVFNERSPEAFKLLSAFVEQARDKYPLIDVIPLQGSFEANAAEMSRLAGRSFRFVFLDPKGWTGFPLNAISAVTQGHSEVLVNLMTSFTRRFVQSDGHPYRQRWLAELIGQKNADEALGNRLSDDVFADLFAEALKDRLQVRFACRSPIVKSGVEDVHYWLVYATGSVAGLDTFRQAEVKALVDHEARRGERRELESRQASLFGSQVDGPFVRLRDDAMRRLPDLVLAEIMERSADFEVIAAKLMERHPLRQTDVKDACVELSKLGLIDATWKTDGSRRKKPKRGDQLRRTAN